jgi:hypothetical protein
LTGRFCTGILFRILSLDGPPPISLSPGNDRPVAKRVGRCTADAGHAKPKPGFGCSRPPWNATLQEIQWLIDNLNHRLWTSQAVPAARGDQPGWPPKTDPATLLRTSCLRTGTSRLGMAGRSRAPWADAPVVGLNCYCDPELENWTCPLRLPRVAVADSPRQAASRDPGPMAEPGRVKAQVTDRARRWGSLVRGGGRGNCRHRCRHHCPLSPRRSSRWCGPASTSAIIGVAVGRALAGHPPHRSVREELPHTAPTSGMTICRSAACRTPGNPMPR